jgi:hypothetical protein
VEEPEALGGAEGQLQLVTLHVSHLADHNEHRSTTIVVRQTIDNGQQTPADVLVRVIVPPEGKFIPLHKMGEHARKCRETSR